MAQKNCDYLYLKLTQHSTQDHTLRSDHSTIAKTIAANAIYIPKIPVTANNIGIKETYIQTKTQKVIK